MTSSDFKNFGTFEIYKPENPNPTFLNAGAMFFKNEMAKDFYEIQKTGIIKKYATFLIFEKTKLVGFDDDISKISPIGLTIVGSKNTFRPDNNCRYFWKENNLVVVKEQNTMSPTSNKQSRTPKKPISNLIMFHDLLGFGATLSSSGGRFDSAIGEIAFARISLLNEALEECKETFPKGTSFFQLNDAVIATIDCDLEINASYQNIDNFKSDMPTEAFFKMLKFIGAAADFHHLVMAYEEELKLGSGGRTFVTLGQRWEIEGVTSSLNDNSTILNANIGFAEAYQADNSGSKAGFDHASNESLYINDYLVKFLKIKFFRPQDKKTIPLLINGSNCIDNKELYNKLDNLGKNVEDSFPQNISTGDFKKISLKIFHKKRYFISLLSDETKEICQLDFLKSV